MEHASTSRRWRVGGAFAMVRRSAMRGLGFLDLVLALAVLALLVYVVRLDWPQPPPPTAPAAAPAQ